MDRYMYLVEAHRHDDSVIDAEDQVVGELDAALQLPDPLEEPDVGRQERLPQLLLGKIRLRPNGLPLRAMVLHDRAGVGQSLRSRDFYRCRSGAVTVPSRYQRSRKDQLHCKHIAQRCNSLPNQGP